jgi:hypothetical protein
MGPNAFGVLVKIILLCWKSRNAEELIQIYEVQVALLNETYQVNTLQYNLLYLLNR